MSDRMVPADVVDAVPLALEADAQLRLHEARCPVCRSTYRAEIEAAYLSWADPLDVAGAFEIGLRALRVHAALLGLDGDRARNLGAGLARVVEARLRTLDPGRLEPSEVLEWAKTAAALSGNAPTGTDGRLPSPFGAGASLTGPARAGETVTWEARVRASRRARGS